MLQEQTILHVGDNSGAKTVQCIWLLGGSKTKYAKLNNIVNVSVKQLWNKTKNLTKVNKKQVYKALVIKTVFRYYSKIGLKKNFNQNTVVLIDKQGNPVGTRILGSVPKILVNKKRFQKFISLSKGFV